MAELTGRRVAAITVGAFGVIVAVNLYMAWQAVATFPGVEVRNPYVASQTFDADRRSQEALGWELSHAYDPRAGELVLRFTDRATGHPAAVAGVAVLVGRATEAASDQRPALVREAGAFVARLRLDPGKWLLRIEAEAEDGTRFRQRRDLYVRG